MTDTLGGANGGQDITMLSTLGAQNATPNANGSLAGILQNVQALQQRPLVPNDPAAQLGVILQGALSGMQGTANPALAQYAKMRDQQVTAGLHQANLALAIEKERLGEARERRQEFYQQQTAARQDEELKLHKQDREQKDREIALHVFTATRDDPNVDVRANAYRLAQSAGVFPADLDPVKAAMVGGKDFDAKRDQVISIAASGGDPFDSKTWGNLYDPTVFGPFVAATQKAMASPGGAMAVNALKSKPDSTENVLKARATYLKTLPEGQRTEIEQRELQAIDDVLKLGPEHGNNAQVLAAQRKKEDADAGRPLKLPSIYLAEAVRDVSDKENFYREMQAEAKRRGFPEGSAQYYDFIRGEQLALAGARAAAVQDQTRLPESERTKLTILDKVEPALKSLMADFSPAERAKYSGWLNFTGRQLTQAMTQDPKFALFARQVAMGKTLAFSDGGKNLTAYEGGITFGWVPTGKELSPADFEVKLKLAIDSLQGTRDSIIRYAVTPSSQVFKDYKAGVNAPPPNPSGMQFKQRGPNEYDVVLPGRR